MLVLKLIGITATLLALAMGGLALQTIFKKNGTFPEHRVGHNREMRKRKVFCVKTQDKMELNKLKKERLQEQQERELLVSGKIYTSNTDFSKAKYSLN